MSFVSMVDAPMFLEIPISPKLHHGFGCVL